MNITKIDLKNELHPESVDEVTKAPQQLNHSNIKDSYLNPIEPPEVGCYFELLGVGLTPQEAENKAKVMTSN